jgi:hypothetical protein
MELLGESFPIPSLLLQLTAVLSDGQTRGRARRVAKMAQQSKE